MRMIRNTKNQFFKDEKAGVVVKIDPEGFIYRVQVAGFLDKSYTHSRNREAFEPTKLAKVLTQFKRWTKASYQDYLNKLRDYHAMEAHHKPELSLAWDNMKQGIEIKSEVL